MSLSTFLTLRVSFYFSLSFLLPLLRMFNQFNSLVFLTKVALKQVLFPTCFVSLFSSHLGCAMSLVNKNCFPKNAVYSIAFWSLMFL